MNPYALEHGTDYDFVSPAITCRADRDGASVYLVPVVRGGVTPNMFKNPTAVRVLAHSQEDAEATMENLHR